MTNIKEYGRKPVFLAFTIFASLAVICSIVNCILTFTASNLFTTIAFIAMIPLCISLWQVYADSQSNRLTSHSLNGLRKSLPIILIGEIVSDIGLVILIVSNHSTWFQGLRPNYAADSVVIAGERTELFGSATTITGDTVSEGFTSAINLMPIVVTVLSAVLVIALACVFVRALDKTFVSAQNVLDGTASECKVNGFELFMVCILTIWGAISIFMYNEFFGVFGLITGIVMTVFYGLMAIVLMQISPVPKTKELTADKGEKVIG